MTQTQIVWADVTNTNNKFPFYCIKSDCDNYEIFYANWHKDTGTPWVVAKTNPDYDDNTMDENEFVFFYFQSLEEAKEWCDEDRQ